MPLSDEPFETNDLSPRQFQQAFNAIQRLKKDNRRSAKRTLPSSLRSKIFDFLSLGTKPDGTGFTNDDLKQFEKVRKQRRSEFNAMESGITYAHMVGDANELRIKRANNTVTDGRGIKNAFLVSLANNVLSMRVTASEVSDFQNHRVQIRLEEWDDGLSDFTGTDSSARKLMKSICAGRMSVECSCKDYQYRYRYLATQAKYAYKTKENSFPKIMNSTLNGTVCKHILKAATKLQSPTMQNWLISRFRQQYGAVGYGNDSNRSTKFVSKAEQQELDKARSNLIDVERIAGELEVFKKAQKAHKKLSMRELDKMRNDLKKARNLVKEKHKVDKELERIKKTEAARKKQAAKALKEQKARNQKQKTVDPELLRIQMQAFIDAYKLTGRTKTEAIKDFAESKGLTKEKLQQIKNGK